MGEKFSWNNLLGKKKDYNTMKIDVNEVNQDLIVPLNSESEEIATSSTAPGPQAIEQPGDHLSNRPPLVIDWESTAHAPTPVGEEAAPVPQQFVEEPARELVGSGVGSTPASAAPGLFPPTLEFDAAMAWLDQGAVTDFQTPKVEHKPEILALAANEEATATLAAKPNLGWDDVELTAAEQEALSYVKTPEATLESPTPAPVEEVNEWEDLRGNHFDQSYVPVSIPNYEEETTSESDEPTTFELGETGESLTDTLAEVSDEYSAVPPPLPGTPDGGPATFEIDAPPVIDESSTVEFERVDTFGDALNRVDESTAPVEAHGFDAPSATPKAVDPLAWANEEVAPPVAIDYSMFSTETTESSATEAPIAEDVPSTESVNEATEFETTTEFETETLEQVGPEFNADIQETHQMDESIEPASFTEEEAPTEVEPEVVAETTEEPSFEQVTVEAETEPVVEAAEQVEADPATVETGSEPTSDGIPDIFKKAMGITVTPPVDDVASTEPESTYSEPEDEPVYVNPVLVPDTSPNTHPTQASASLTDLPADYTTSDVEIDTQRSKDVRLGDLLIENRLITQRQLERALERQEQTHEKLGVILVAMQTISERRLLQVLAAQRGVTPWHLEENELEPEVLALVPEEMCRVYQVLPVAVRGDQMILAMKDVRDAEAIESVRQHTNKRIEPALADETRLAYFIDQAFGSAGEAKAQESTPEPDQTVEQAMTVVSEIGDSEDLTEEAADAVDMIVRRTIEEGIRLHASDIHFEPQEDHAEIRYRLDGQLMKMRDIPLPLVPIMTEQLLELGKFDPESDSPQDGKTFVDYTGPKVGLRMAALPSLHGTRITMRILDKSVGLRKIDGLGFEEQNLAIFKELIAKPYGLFLVTGPTGSGKTTTLYAAIDELKRSATNIMTCEDPVEYDIAGISQAEVNEKGGLDFGDHLKAILRQDPDVMLIGEIRDKETAEVAIRAAMSGHMVLSTMHCNDAASAVPHLLDMGIDPFLLSSALVGTVSQRLIRVLCPDCKKEEAPTADEANVLKKYFGLDGVEKVWHACGCNKCRNTGYKGRTAVHEIVPVTDEVSAQIAERAPLEQIKRTASYYGYLPMQQDAIARVLSGQTTVDEARRVLQFDTISKRSEPRTINLPKSA